MKKAFVYLFAVTSLSLNSCGGSNEKEKGSENDSTATENSELDLEGMVEHDLSGSGLKANLMVPEEMSPNNVPFPVRDSVLIEGVAWEVLIGENYKLILEEADGKGNLIANEKKRLEETGIYDLTYEIDKPNVILYQANLKNGAGSKAFYHVYGIVKIEGKDFIAKSDEAGDFNKGQAEKMLKSIMAMQK